MHRIKLILGAALALTFAGGSAYIVYHDRPVVRLQGQVVAAGGESEEVGDDVNEGEGVESGAVIPVGTSSVPAPAIPPPPAPASEPAPTPAPAPKPAPSGYTMTDVRAHSSANDCWSAIDGNVYDLTSWISRHPGGQAVIIALCGKDGSAAYDGQHGGQQRPLYYLTLLKIGALR